MIDSNLVFLLDRRQQRILLALKKKGFGEGKWNGVGGKVKSGETQSEAAVRETWEEVHVKIEIEDLQQVALLDFHFQTRPDWDQQVMIFFAEKWQGEPQESAEMRPQWYDLGEIPLEQMWLSDRQWLPQVLAGRKLTGKFFFDSQSRIKNFSLTDL